VVKLPLENVHILDEQHLTQTLKYTIPELTVISTCLVPYGGLAEMGVQAGSTVIIAPSTGRFGGAAVVVALAMGAKVIAIGRSMEKLSKLKTIPYAEERLALVEISNDIEKGSAALSAAVGAKGADFYLDFSPAEACKNGTPSHIPVCLGALKVRGQACIMGGIFANVEVPYGLIMLKSLTLRGKFMYSREQLQQMLKLVQFGNLKLGESSGGKISASYGLDQAEEAFKMAKEKGSWGENVIFTPNA
jgi:D-arabinose 1-dehydrogenase-like Zn-dependent alcohol dehydrogenase